MVDKRLIQEWLNKAEEDFNFASRNIALFSLTFM